jgi:hypothetical protein
VSPDTSEGGFCQFLAIDAWHGYFSTLCWMAEMTVGANLTDEIPAVPLKFRNELTNLHYPQRSRVAISGVLVQPFRLFWYGENDVLVQRRPEVIST